jgi:septal ring factor EnvC (AmiA/AmiB activator)
MDKERRDKVFRLLLRSMPLSILPGPELYDLFQDLTKTRTDLDKKVDEAVTAIQKASALMSELETTLTDRTAKLKSLRAEVERISQLAAVEEKNAAPLLRELDALLAKGRTRERILAFAINIVAGVLVFIAGAYFGPLLLK